MLTVTGLTKRYGEIKAVDGLSFEVPKGICFGLLGPNGAGKTTTISMIAGTVDPDGGDVTLDGVSVAQRSAEAKQRIGYVPQELAIYEDLSAIANLHFFGALYGLFGADCDRAIDRVLEVVGLADRAREPVKRFSGGMKRRLNIAVGLLHDPELMIFDEPTVGVDPQTRNAIFETLTALREQGKTLIYTTHYMEEVERLCQEVAIMDHGRIVAQGDLRTLKNSDSKVKEVSVYLHGAIDLPSETAIPGVLNWNAEDTLLRFEMEDLGVSLAAALTFLCHNGAAIISVRTAEASLEQIFLQATGKSLRD
ncbi:MAG TPA: ABC transporter ATP-binding protein [Fimbriimonas sp.]|nr:ABC transporter ATP-binding protein [Fimbriimonas sp.]